MSFESLFNHLWIECFSQQVLTKVEYFCRPKFLSFLFFLFCKNIIVCGDDYEILSLKNFTLKKNYSFFSSDLHWHVDYWFFAWYFFPSNSRIFNIWFETLRIVSKDAFDFVDVRRYLQSRLTTLRNCKIAKTDLEGKKRPFFPQVPS